jgi:glyoxylase-like metal-dependent hydrolase (beta-lactamase superfamily II)
MQKLALGEFELIAVADGTYLADGGAFFGVVPKVLWERKTKADAQNRIVAGLNSVVVRAGRQTVLIETGSGNKLPERLIKIYGQPALLLKNLASAGVAPEDVDIVINSHLHYDHCGWNTVRQGDKFVATFPRATYYVQEGEWQHAHENQRDGVSYLAENYDPLVESGQMKLLRGEAEITPGISVRVYPGHTRDMQAILVSSGGRTACYISDLIPTSAHLDPNWVMSFDLYPLETIESRKRYYAQAIPERWLTMFTHDPKVPWAYLAKDEKGKVVMEQGDV